MEVKDKKKDEENKQVYALQDSLDFQCHFKQKRRKKRKKAEEEE